MDDESFDTRKGKVGTADADECGQEPDLRTLLHRRMPYLSRAEQAIASYILRNPDDIHFETGASIARAVGVSEMTVSRFTRTLGFANLREMKRSLRRSLAAAVQGDDGARIPHRELAHADPAAASALRHDLDAVVFAYNRLAEPRWQAMVEAVKAAPRLFVVALGRVESLAHHISHRIGMVRPDVSVIARKNLHPEALKPDMLLLLLDGGNAGADDVRLACRLAEAGVRAIILTPDPEVWPAAQRVIPLPPSVREKGIGLSLVGLSATIDLLVAAVD